MYCKTIAYQIGFFKPCMILQVKRFSTRYSGH